MFAAAATLILPEQADPGANTLRALTVGLSQVVSGIGVVIIAWGSYSFLLRLISNETAAARGQVSKADAVAGRAAFASYLLPAIDFMVAGSLIRMFAVADWQQAVALAVLVFARMMIGLSLRWGVTPVPTVQPATEPLHVPGSLLSSTAADTIADRVAPVGNHTAP